MVLDREVCFNKWVELRTLPNVSKWFADQGIINPFTKKPYTVPAISYAARRWVCENSYEAREIYSAHGWNPDDAVWDAWLAEQIIKVFHSHRTSIVENLLAKAGLLDAYGYLVGKGEEPPNRRGSVSKTVRPKTFA